MQTTAAQIADYLQRFRCGDIRTAFFGLLEMEHEVVPELISVFHNEKESDIRAFLVEVIWQHRQPSVIPFLAEALFDPEAAVWKQALDGLVTLASPAALAVLQAAKACQFATHEQKTEFVNWLDEAINQAKLDIQKKLDSVKDGSATDYCIQDM
jgi:hypothetical protein